MAKLNINGKEFNEAELNEEAKAQVTSLRFVESELHRLQNLISVTSTARNVYAHALTSDLPEKEAPKNVKKDTVVIEGKRYAYKDMSEKAKSNAVSIAMVDERLEQLKREISFAQTARNGYIHAFEELVK